MPMCILLVAMAVGVTLLPAPTAAAGRAVVEPLPMSAVTLKGEWKEKGKFELTSLQDEALELQLSVSRCRQRETHCHQYHSDSFRYMNSFPAQLLQS